MSSIVAFDVAKAELVGARMRKNGTVAERYTVVNTSEAINQFLDTLPKKKITIGSEATAEYHLHLARACLARGVPFKLINPLVTKQFTRATIRKRKTDRDDAEIIGKCLLQGAGRELTPHDLMPATRILRTACDLSQMARTMHLKHKRFVEHFPETTAVQAALAEAEDALRRAARLLHSHGTGLVSHTERALAQSIVGIGGELAPVIVSEIGDPTRFKGGKQLVAYAGLDPKVKQSGKSLARNTAITKRGSPYLRRALFIAASVAQRYDPELKAYYEKKRAEGKHYSPATIANARHLAHRVLAVLKRGTPYVKRELSTAST
ncbi:hypothetical protein A2763_01235 [Candidatus Kaiserbacteria bacterium RIFCSPHIGHO2_01_FULL_54_36]|uniref:Uncharacterized protein n=1 Tax=Candidatus Kaiserbacteria bacterium RIFCSPHIGHO2_01_FULL_54_36 TaxID=1798482 RepID=A0A1F6CN27_9BACT|nr:MAG: hypothetical protein A2763_01235 [Candidatus Kaiserbacteria bacterium RIFCSPHIGHO2_01_FULL_54_36]